MSDGVFNSHESVIDLSLQMLLLSTAYRFVLKERMSRRTWLAVIVLSVSSAGHRWLAHFKAHLTTKLAP